jgi:hypothetical protein
MSGNEHHVIAPPTPAPYKSKTLATWVAFFGGAFGLHRLYLKGFGDVLGWLHAAPTLAGLVGVQRTLELGQDDRLSWLLLPLLGLMLTLAMAHAIAYGLTPDERWDARHNAGRPGPATGWGPVLGVIAALMVGSGMLMATIAYSGQRFFEWQLERAPATTGR